MGSYTPANNATNVATSARPTVTFTEPMDSTTITVSSIKLLRPDSTQVGISPTYNSATNTVTLAVQTSLDLSTQYTIVVEPTVKSLATGTPLAAQFSSRFTTTSTAVPVRIDAGSTTSYTDSNQNVWSADSWYRFGSTRSVTTPIGNTNDQILYQKERYGGWTYNIPVPNGTWTVRFCFVETLKSGPGQRVFSVDINDTPTNPDIANLDIYVAAGNRANWAYDRTITGVTITDNSFSIRAIAVTDNPEIAAIELIRTGP